MVGHFKTYLLDYTEFSSNMVAFRFVLLIIACLAYVSCEKCVSETRFNELEEFINIKFEELKNENKELKERLATLELKLETEENIIDDVEHMVETEILENDETKEQENETGSRIRRYIKTESSGIMKRQGETAVAFHTYLSGKRCYGKHETFIFDSEEINYGNGYSSQDGIFDAPVSGVYVFTITVVPDFYTYIQAEIIVNGVVKGVAFADSNEIHDIHPASATVVVHVSAGQHVYIRIGQNSNCNVVSDGAQVSRTTFSGWLLF